MRLIYDQSTFSSRKSNLVRRSQRLRPCQQVPRNPNGGICCQLKNAVVEAGWVGRNSEKGGGNVQRSKVKIK